MPRIAEGHRDEQGRWHAANPDDYPPLDVHGTLPWSVLRQDSKTWQTRKKWWHDQGVDDTSPRAHAAGMMNTGRHGRISGGISKFDPHLAEALYTWYCPPGGTVLDPCAGGPVRGLVAAHLGLRYTGIDLSAAQVNANRARELEWQRDGRSHGGVLWIEGDAREELHSFGTAHDYVLMCPPYHNRERYSDDPRDLSAMPWPAFCDALHQIIAAAMDCLRPDRFATIVISDVRDHRGHLRRLPDVAAGGFEAAGARLVNEQILVAPLGLAAKRMRGPWEAARTTTRIHQLVLTFVKGDRRAATRAVREAAC